MGVGGGKYLSINWRVRHNGEGSKSKNGGGNPFQSNFGATKDI